MDAVSLSVDVPALLRIEVRGEQASVAHCITPKQSFSTRRLPTYLPRLPTYPANATTSVLWVGNSLHLPERPLTPPGIMVSTRQDWRLDPRKLYCLPFILCQRPTETLSLATLPTFPDLLVKVGLVMAIGQTRVEGSSTWDNGAVMARVLSQHGVKLFGCHLSLEAANPPPHVSVMKAGMTRPGAPASISEERAVGIAIGLEFDKRLPCMPSRSTHHGKARFWRCRVKFGCCRNILIGKAASSVQERDYLSRANNSTAKAALLHFTRVTAVIYAPKNGRMDCVVRGMIYTPHDIYAHDRKLWKE
ncbi:short chain type dehydrogenase [Paraphaeosphaeria minitans]|uniref:Short chain type dehydrogenase n=1 Tax=Paraphaeosphaeria minitans TaxID=565426 RepID=A0A9P6GPN2_9PLEO|nr:short chain type dehydrogenase [Paraphaeosphaeria minitans]